MKNFMRRIAVVIGATALSAGLMTVASPAAQAAPSAPSARDTQWP